VIGALPFWDELRRRAGAQAALRGVNAAVVGLLLAAFYQPVWTTGIANGADFALATTHSCCCSCGRRRPGWWSSCAREPERDLGDLASDRAAIRHGAAPLERPPDERARRSAPTRAVDEPAPARALQAPGAGRQRAQVIGLGFAGRMQPA